ncbi:MAG: hypothetical protein A3G93_15235 [Nitrospinae bacterium RIFCSPLOWO2_12_FULL_45_22]|nr:MAG: hypothetical protein A3G93_15235 [Nitrospinae bacterium RIFCSPLOWO2_12_FULL_45_22]
MSYWDKKRVLVTGGAGFIGSHLVEMLVEEGARVKVVDNLSRGEPKNLDDCREKIDFIKGDLSHFALCEEVCTKIDVVMHLAAKVAGVGYNLRHPGTMFYANVLINTNMLGAARKARVKRFLCVSSACVYTRHCSIPTPESEGFQGDPEPTNFGYGWSKRIAEIQARCYSEEFGMEIAIVRPYNAYGPRDDFDLDVAHVIPALIRKVMEEQDPLVVWGDGEQTRAFVYVSDLVRGMMLAAEKYPKADPLNIGTEEEVKIKDLVELILSISGKRPRVIFDPQKPAGQPRRNADISKAKKLIGYEPQVSLKEGLEKTIEWYRSQGRKRI